jgi:hypothetical protein
MRADAYSVGTDRDADDSRASSDAALQRESRRSAPAFSRGEVALERAWPGDDVAVVPANVTSIATYRSWRNPFLGRSPRAAKFVPARYFPSMSEPTGPNAAPAPTGDATARLEAIVGDYQITGDVGLLFDQVRALARTTDAAALKSATEPFREMPEVVIPAFESIVASSPTDAQAMVILANSYWLSGRGPEAVQELATRALAVDGQNRGAWHLWALANPTVRGRVERWQEVARRFPADQLARAALADNATSLAHDEHDPLALQLAIDTYESLLAESTQTAQRMALRSTLDTLRGWSV